MLNYDTTSNDVQDIIIKNIRTLRKEKKLSQEKFAIILGVSKSSIAHWELKQREMSLHMLKKIADFFDVSLSFLFGESQLKNENESIKYFIEKLETQTNLFEENEINDKIVDQIIELITFINKFDNNNKTNLDTVESSDSPTEQQQIKEKVDIIDTN